jgi:hypothetical protein
VQQAKLLKKMARPDFSQVFATQGLTT